MHPYLRKVVVAALILAGAWWVFRARTPTAAAARETGLARAAADRASDRPPEVVAGAGGERRATAALPAADPPAPPVSTAGLPRETLHVVVRAAEGGLIEGAQVFEKVEDELRELGRTDKHGDLEASLSPGVPRVILATADGYAAASSSLPAQAADEVLLTLATGASLSGRVTTPDGSAIGGVTVAAMPSSLALFVGQTSWTRVLSDPEVRLTSSEPDGRFALADLDRSLRYTVVAGGSGTIQKMPVHGLAVGAREIEVVVHPAYAARLLLHEPDGTPAKLTPDYSGPGGVRVAVQGSVGGLAAGYPLTYWLAGLPESFQRLEPSERLYVFTSEAPEPSVGPIHLSASPPGYRASELRIDVRPLQDGVETFAWTLEPTGEGFGSVACGVELPAGVSETRRFGKVGQLRLAKDDGGELVYALQCRIPTSARFDHIPRGRYQASFETWPDRAQVAASSPTNGWIEVGPEPQTVRFDLSNAGGYELHPVAPDGRPYRGELTVALRIGDLETEADGDTYWHGGRVAFVRPPYIQIGLAPGSYAVRLQDPRPKDNPWRPVEVENGVTAAVALPMR